MRKRLLEVTLLVVLIALGARLWNEAPSPSSFQMPESAVNPTWKLYEEDPNTPRFCSYAEFCKEFAQLTPMSRDEFMLFRLSERGDESWTLLGPGRAATYTTESTEQVGPTPVKLRAVKNLAGTDALMARLRRVRWSLAWSGRPPWLQFFKEQPASDWDLGTALCFCDDTGRLRAFTLKTDDPQVHAVTQPGLALAAEP